MQRLELIQQLIDARGYSTYLEIGVLGGGVFFKVKCKRKIAVDPDFRFNWKGKLGEMWSNPSNIAASYFEMTSDRFFEIESDNAFGRTKVDLVLVDGMHEFDFALRDVENSLRYLSEDGVIVMHDCNPLTAEASCTYDEWKQRNFTGHWNGDVWKVILYLRQARTDLDVFVADCDHGLGVIAKLGPTKLESPAVNKAAIRALGFKDLDDNRTEWLNLKPPSYLTRFFGD